MARMTATGRIVNPFAPVMGLIVLAAMAMIVAAVLKEHGMSDIDFVPEEDTEASSLSAEQDWRVDCNNHCVFVPDVVKFADDWGVSALRVDFKTGVIQGLDGYGEWADMGKHRSCEQDKRPKLRVVDEE